jgi:hypothetical protein
MDGTLVSDKLTHRNVYFYQNFTYGLKRESLIGFINQPSSFSPIYTFLSL